MRLRSILTIALILVFATAAFAEKPVKRTVIVKDGRVITDTTEPFEFILREGELLGKRAILGVNVVELTAELREHYGAGRESGVLVGAVEDGGPADKAGVRVGDIITAVDGKEIASASALRRALKEKKEGDSVRVDVLRGRSRQTLVASVIERDSAPLLPMRELEALGAPGEWRTRVSAMPNCVELQAKIKELESKMKELEKKLQK